MNQESIQRFLTMELTPAQRSFVESTERFTMFAGGHGMGIGFALRRALTEIAINEAGIRIAVFTKGIRGIYSDLRNDLVLSGIASEKEDWPRGLALKNGSKIYFCTGKNLKAFYHFAGKEFKVIAIYDAQDIRESEHDFITTMNRCVNGTPRILYTAHPGGIGHSWIKRLFIDRKYKEGEKPTDYRFIKASVQDNPYLKNDEEYQRALRNLPDDLRSAYFEGDWDPTGNVEEPICRVGKEQYEYLLQLRDKGAKYLWMNERENMFATSEIPVFDGPPSFSLRSVILGVSKEGPFGGWFEPYEAMDIEEQISAYERDNGITPLRAGEGAE